MTRDEFKLIHSELIMQVQMIENDLRMICAVLMPGDFEDNYDTIDRAGLGEILRELKKADEIDGKPDLPDSDYELIDRIREMRNYWCHQCYLDFVYVQDDGEREARFQEIAARLKVDEEKTWALHKHLEKLRLGKLKEYHRI